MKIVIAVIILFLNCCYASDFGEYRYSKYLGLQQQLQYQRARQLRAMRAQKLPAQNIRYPSPNNPYPNIQRNNYHPISPRARYSARYYQSL